MLHFLFCLNLFHNGGEIKHPFHRKQFLFKRRRGPFGSFSPSLALLLLSVPRPLVPILLPRTGQNEGQGYFLGPKCQKVQFPHLGFRCPPACAYLARSGGLELCPRPPPGRAGKGSFQGLWHWNNLACFSMDHWNPKSDIHLWACRDKKEKPLTLAALSLPLSWYKEFSQGIAWFVGTSLQGWRPVAQRLQSSFVEPHTGPVTKLGQEGLRAAGSQQKSLGVQVNLSLFLFPHHS